MKKELKKITLIVDEILTFMLHHGAEDINIQVNKNKGCTDIQFEIKDCDFDKGFVEKLKFDLKNHRQNELEGYYWQLVGKDDITDELYLVGAMIDDSKVNFDENVLSIEIKRTC